MSTFSPSRVADIYLSKPETFAEFAPMLSDDMLAEVMAAVEVLKRAAVRKVIRSKVTTTTSDADVDNLHESVTDTMGQIMASLPVVERYEMLKDGAQGALKAREQRLTINGADGVKWTLSASLPVGDVK